MNLTVLGKYGPYGKSGTGAASSYLVDDDGTYLVLDMGPGTLSRLQAAVDVKKLGYVFISHLHYDHTSDFLAFRYLLEDLDHRITLITRYEDSSWYKLLATHPNIDVINVNAESKFKIGNMNLSFYDMKHTVPCLAIRIESGKTLVYTGDTMYNSNIPPLVKDADTVLADCSKPMGFKGPHMTVDIAKRIQLSSGARVIATHLSPDYDPHEDFKNCKNIIVAEELTTYEI